MSRRTPGRLHDARRHRRQRERDRPHPGHQRADGPHHGHLRRVDPRAERGGGAALRDPRDRDVRPRGGGGRESPCDRRGGEGGGGPRGLRHHDPRPLLPRLRHPPAAQAGPAHRSLLRHPAAVLRLPLRAAARGRPRPVGPREDGPAGRCRGAHRLHALDAGELRLRPRRVRRAPDEGGVGLELALPAPGRAVRRRRLGRGAARGRGRGPGRPRPRAARGGGGLREALRARHRVQAPPLHGPRAVPAGRPHPGHGRALRLQDGHHQHGGRRPVGPGEERGPRPTS